MKETPSPDSLWIAKMNAKRAHTIVIWNVLCLDTGDKFGYVIVAKWRIRQEGVTHTSSSSIQNFTYCKHLYSDLIMRVPSLSSPSPVKGIIFRLILISFPLFPFLPLWFCSIKGLPIHGNVENPSIFFKVWWIGGLQYLVSVRGMLEDCENPRTLVHTLANYIVRMDESRKVEVRNQQLN